MAKLTEAQLRAAMREMGSRGGKSRAKNNRPLLKKWAALGGKYGKLGAEYGKLGGRPKGSKDTKPRKPRSKKGKSK